MKKIPWGGVTNPLEHDPENFRYLVHMDTGKSRKLASQRTARYYIDDIGALFTAPRLSTSLISNNRSRAFAGMHGFIVEVPEEDVLATHSGDMWSSVWSTEQIKKQWPVMPADEILNGPATWPTNNEVIILPGRLSITGLLATAERYYSTTHSIDFLQANADELGVPLVTVDPYPPR